jgi:hypothetical protein
MDNPMAGKKDTEVKCPACGEMLSLESKGASDSEQGNLKPKPKMNASNMPMGQLRSKITPTSPMPGATPSNLNSY